MNVAYFIDSVVRGGAEEVVVQNARIVSERAGYRVWIYHFGNQYISDFCKQHNIKDIILPIQHAFKSSKRMPLFWWGFRKILRKDNPDILHSHLYGAITGACIPARLAGIPHLGTLHDIYMIEDSPLRAIPVRFSAMVGTTLCAVSEQMRQFYLQRTRLAPERILLNYNGVHLLNSQASRDGLRSNFGINPDDVVVTFVGRMVALKRVDKILEIARMLDLPNIKFLLIGEGEEFDDLQQSVMRYNLENKVIFTGYRSDIEDLLCISDMYMLISTTEGLSCSLLEAMSAGLPAVVSDVGGNGEIVQHGVNGFVHPVEDIERRRDSVRQIACDKTLRAKLGAAARERIETQFSLHANVERYLQIYDSILKK
jgi:glycosyltransferase involved in cell wall biosynthesis